MKIGKNEPIWIDVLDPAYEPLAYPLLYPVPDAGWSIDMVSNKGEKVSQQARYRHLLLSYHRFTHFSRLTQEWCVDMYCRMEEERLRHIHSIQHKLRMAPRDELMAALGEIVDNQRLYQPGRIFLPTSFIGGPRFTLHCITLHYIVRYITDTIKKSSTTA